MIRIATSGVVFFLLYLILITPFTNYLKNKPFVEKLGYVPSVMAFKAVAADHKELVAALLILKVNMYFGGLLEKADNRLAVPPDYMMMSRILHGSTKLDPYNMDAYYFAQGFLTWDVKQYRIANELLDYGMKYRTWDWYLPFFAGFNSAFFLKDYAAAARYYQRAGELSGSDLSHMLAGRYMLESGQTELAVKYLSVLLKGEKNPALRKNYQIRLKAFMEVRRIEIARDQYTQSGGSLPVTLDALLRSGLLTPSPSDPYGGQFYIDSAGKVQSTSRYAFSTGRNTSIRKAGEPDERH